jgi:hypothetical protein
VVPTPFYELVFIYVILFSTNSNYPFLNYIGSVATFILCPYVYEHLGLTSAIWLSADLSIASICAAIGAYYLIKKLSDLYASKPAYFSPPDTLESQAALTASPAYAYAKRASSPRFQETEESSLSLLPFFQLSGSYYLYACAGMLLYGSMVPFWFTGSKYLQEYYGLSVQSADALILIPEGSIILLSFPMGYLLDNYLTSAPTRLLCLCISTALLPLGYALLMASGREPNDESGEHEHADPASPLLAMLVLGVGYGISNCMFWTSFMQVIPENLIGPGSGLIASLLNVLPAIVPVVASRSVSIASPGNWNLFILSVLGVMSCCFSLSCSYSIASRERSETQLKIIERELGERNRLIEEDRQSLYQKSNNDAKTVRKTYGSSEY